ncbi:MAG: glycoside hydrolase family 43 protein [Candidatus Limnocylindria bacterium]
MGVIPRLVIFAAVIVGIAAYVVAYGAQPAYENPVLANDAPDPAVFRTDDGTYYAYATQAYFDAKFINVPILRSTDLVQWELVGDAFPANPDWATRSPGDMWAPHMMRWEDGTYRLFFSAARRDNGEMAIGVATADSPTGPFTDSGGPIITGQSFSAIDPFVLEYGGTNYVYWGSAGEPISAQELTADGTGVRGSPIEVLPRSSGEYESLIEGAWVTEHDDRFYLMYSGDACCGPEAHYAVMVARSDSPLGPYSRNPDNPILEANEEFNAPGHHATIAGPDGSDWILYHAMVRPETSFRSLFLDRIDWVDGWPVINGGNGPSDCSTDAPHDPPIPRLPMCGD